MIEKKDKTEIHNSKSHRGSLETGSGSIGRLLGFINSKIEAFKNSIREFLQDDGIEGEIELSDGSNVLIRYLEDEDRTIEGKYRAIITRGFDKEGTIIEQSTLENMCVSDPGFNAKYVLAVNEDRETVEEIVESINNKIDK